MNKERGIKETILKIPFFIYGKTYMRNNKNTTNNNTYKKMKNKIKYGRSPENGYQNHGDFTIA